MRTLTVSEHQVKYTRTRVCRRVLVALVVLLISLAAISCTARSGRAPARAPQAVDAPGLDAPDQDPSPEAVATLGRRWPSPTTPSGIASLPESSSGLNPPPLAVVIGLLVVAFFVLNLLFRVVQALIEGLLRLQRTLLRLLSVVFVATVLAGIGLAATS